MTAAPRAARGRPAVLPGDPRALRVLVGICGAAAAVAEIASGRRGGTEAIGQGTVVLLLAAALVGLAAARRDGRRTVLVASGLVAALTYTATLRATDDLIGTASLAWLVPAATGTWCLALTLRRTSVVDRPPGPATHPLLAAGGLVPPVVLLPLWAIALAGDRGREGLPVAALLDLGVVVPAGVLTTVLVLRRRPGGVEVATVLFVAEAALMAVFTAPATVAPRGPGDWLPTAALGVVFLALAVAAVRSGRPVPPQQPAVPADRVGLAA